MAGKVRRQDGEDEQAGVADEKVFLELPADVREGMREGDARLCNRARTRDLIDNAADLRRVDNRHLLEGPESEFSDRGHAAVVLLLVDGAGRSHHINSCFVCSVLDCTIFILDEHTAGNVVEDDGAYDRNRKREGSENGARNTAALD